MIIDVDDDEPGILSKQLSFNYLFIVIFQSLKMKEELSKLLVLKYYLAVILFLQWFFFLFSIIYLLFINYFFAVFKIHNSN